MTLVRHWVIRHAGAIERLYRSFEYVLVFCRPLFKTVGFHRLEKPVAFIESRVKKFFFGCHMCGECTLMSTGMACPMTCRKSLRNGPCGGVRPDGSCELDKTIKCTWVNAWEGASRMDAGAAIGRRQRPVHYNKFGRSSWLRVAQKELSAVGDLNNIGQTKKKNCEQEHARGRGLLEEKLRQGEFVVTVELSPPDSSNPEDILSRARLFGNMVDAINITDGSNANCHLSSLAAAVLLKQEGYTPILQATCRDRNRIALQGDILGAAALGIENLLCLTGDGVENGDHPGAKPVFDLDSISLLGAVRGMCDEGRFLSGRHLKSAPNIFLGAAANPFAPPFDIRAVHMAKKIDAGANFIQTQYCFDINALRDFMRKVRALDLHNRAYILVGVGPLVSLKAANWMNENVPGINIPENIIKRMQTTENPKLEGKQICIELIREIVKIKGVAGVHIMAHRCEEMVPEILEESGLRGRNERKLNMGATVTLPVKQGRK